MCLSFAQQVRSLLKKDHEIIRSGKVFVLVASFCLILLKPSLNVCHRRRRLRLHTVSQLSVACLVMPFVVTATLMRRIVIIRCGDIRVRV
jgi:hypothetical protein